MPLVRFRSTNKPEVRADYLSINVIDCLKSPIFPQDRRERALRAATLTESSLKVRETAINFTSGVGDEACFESNYKMVASDGKCSISTILRQNKAL